MAISPDIYRNDPKFYPRWNERLPRTSLHTGTRYSARSDWNGIEAITLCNTANKWSNY